MSWLVLCDCQSPSGKTAICKDPGLTSARHADILSTGSLMLEVATGLPERGQVELLRFNGASGDGAPLVITLSAGGRVTVKQSLTKQNPPLCVTGLSGAAEHYLRITFSWDGDGATATLSVEDLNEATLYQAETTEARGLSRRALERICSQQAMLRTDPSVVYFGVSDQVEPVGLVAGIGQNAPVATPSGPRPIEDIRAGDLVLTEDAGPQPVLWSVSREVPGLGRFRPLRLRAPYMGLTRDILVLPEQQILQQGVEVEYLFGEESVLCEARHMGPRFSPVQTRHPGTIRCFQLLLGSHDILSVAGCRLDSLYIGKIADNPHFLRSSILRNVPKAMLPRHNKLARLQLRGYEALTLGSAMTA